MKLEVVDVPLAGVGDFTRFLLFLFMLFLLGLSETEHSMSSNCLRIPSASAATSVASDGGGRLTKSWHLPLKSSSLLELLAAELDEVVLAIDKGLERVLRTAFLGIRLMLTSCG